MHNLHQTLAAAESFIAGFEDDVTQSGVANLLTQLRHAQQHTPPALGQPWPDQGGIYVGTLRGLDGQPDQHLILATEVPTARQSWDAATAWAAAITADGHTDFTLPTRREGRLLFANAQAEFGDDWFWLAEQYSRNFAWGQYFDGGVQLGSDKAYEGRARAVRRFAAE